MQTESTSAVPLYDHALDRHVLYRDGLFVRLHTSPRFGFFPEKSHLVATSRFGHFDNQQIALIGGDVYKDTYMIVYDASVSSGETTVLQVGILLTDRKHPWKVIYRSHVPLFQTVCDGTNPTPLGIVRVGTMMRIYWFIGDTIVVGVCDIHELGNPIKTAPLFHKLEKNPIITSRKTHVWEREGTFNPAAFVDDEGIVHILYRALGADGISRVGYARTKDGVHMDVRLEHPVFNPSLGYGLPDPREKQFSQTLDRGIFPSGGGSGGAEDPRAVLIDGRVYMTYVAFEGWHSVRMAVTSISLSDLKQGVWNWSMPLLLSPLGEVHKNWVIFPEKIDGKYAVVHSISPEVKIDYLDSLDGFSGVAYIRSPSPRGGRVGYWDNRVRGAGPPPIKTKLGWLLLYHAMDYRDPDKYKLGAMILDSKDPTKILFRAHAPLLSPDEFYENDGKPGVIYASGAVIRGEYLYIYYGGADKVVCVAKTKLDDLLNYLQHGTTDFILQKA
jgi:predicted GH43/DUF377 family glycosyl hydrolase